MSLFGRSRGGSNALQKLIKDFEPPTFPTATLRVLEVLRHADSTPADVAAALEADPGTVVRLLRMVNAASYGLRTPVQDVGHAVQMVGRSALESLLIGATVRQIVPSEPRTGFDPRRFWTLAARRAAVARRLAALRGNGRSESIFTAALLQDIAVPLLLERQGDRYSEILERWQAGEAELSELEREAFGWDHAEVGRLVCEAWSLPGELSTAVGAHHQPADSSEAAGPELRLSALLRDDDEAETAAERLADAFEGEETEREQVMEGVRSGFEEGAELAGVLV